MGDEVRGDRIRPAGSEGRGRVAVRAADSVRKDMDDVRVAYARTVADHGQTIQVSNTTKLDRYPVVFRAVAALAAAAKIEQPHILSFGSSTGEEVFTLTQYFPGASVLGLDISDAALEQARARYGHVPGVRFEKSGEFAVEPHSVDLIFAMSVLCRWPVTKQMDSIGHLYPFSAFEQHVTNLDTLLKPGGLLVIYNANYGFLHSRVSTGYDLVVHPTVRRAGQVRRFRRDGVFDPTVSPTDVIYRKRPAGEGAGERGLRILNESLEVIAAIERDIDVR